MFGKFQEVAVSSLDYNLITPEDYQSAEVLFVVLNKGEILISKLTARRRITNRSFLRLGNHPEIINSEQSIELLTVPDLYYDGKEIIYLKNYSTVRSLLPGLEYFFRTAIEE